MNQTKIRINLALAVLALVLLAACGGQEVTTEQGGGAGAQPLEAQPAPTPGCGWEWVPLWNLPAHAVCVQACPGATIAPLAAGSDGRCDVATYETPNAQYCDDARVWHVPPDSVVIWSRVGETRNRFSWGQWECAQ
jgi:hypothetical protein